MILRFRWYQIVAALLFAGAVYVGFIEELTVVRRYRIPIALNAIGIGHGSIWAVQFGNRVGAPNTSTLVRLDSGLTKVLARIELETASFGSNFGFGPAGTWLTEGGGSANLIRVDPRTNAILTTIPVGNNARYIALTDRAVWVTASEKNLGKHSLYRVDPATHGVTAVVSATGSGPIVAGYDAVWVVDAESGSVNRIDPRTNSIVARITVFSPVYRTLPSPQLFPRQLLAGEGFVWVLHGSPEPTPQPSFIARIDPARNQLVGDFVEIGTWSHVAVGGGYLWVATYDRGLGGRLLRFDPRTMKPIGAPFKVGTFVSRMDYGLDFVTTVAVFANPETDPTIVQQIAFQSRWRRLFSRVPR